MQLTRGVIVNCLMFHLVSLQYHSQISMYRPLAWFGIPASCDQEKENEKQYGNHHYTTIQFYYNVFVWHHGNHHYKNDFCKTRILISEYRVVWAPPMLLDMPRLRPVSQKWFREVALLSSLKIDLFFLMSIDIFLEMVLLSLNGDMLSMKTIISRDGNHKWLTSGKRGYF